nr:unnamed protein product [Callosobruchus analis]
MPLTRDQIADVKLIIRETIIELFSDENFVTTISNKIEQKLGIKESQQKVNNLEKQLADLRRAKNKLECDVEWLQQHIRRKSFRVFGLEETQGESALEQLRTLCREKLKTYIAAEDIENCFWTGRSRNGKRAVLFTVNSHDLKFKLLESRKLLRGTKITLSEDMTPTRYQLYKAAVQKYDRQKAWFYDGKVWVKIGERKYEIKTEEDLHNLA